MYPCHNIGLRAAACFGEEPTFMWLKFRGIRGLARIFVQNIAFEQLTGKIFISNNLADDLLTCSGGKSSQCGDRLRQLVVVKERSSPRRARGEAKTHQSVCLTNHVLPDRGSTG